MKTWLAAALAQPSTARAFETLVQATQSVPRATLATPPPRLQIRRNSRRRNSRRRNSSHHLTTHRCSTLHPTPTPTRHRARHSYRPDVAYTARQCRPAADPTFSRLPRRIHLHSSRSRASLWHGLQCSDGRAAPMRRGMACVLAGLPSNGRLPHRHRAPPSPPPESQVARRHEIRSRRAQLNACRAFRFD